MHPTAKKCLQWAVAPLILGGLVTIYGTQAYVGLSDLAGANAQVGLDAINIVLTVVRSAVFSVGAALVGAAVVIQTLAGRAGSNDRGN